MPGQLANAVEVARAVPEVGVDGTALGWRSWKPSAGYDTTSVGKAGMKALVGLNTSASLLNLADAQAAKLRKVVQVASIRASETQRVLKYLQENSEGPAWSMASGPGFGRGEPSAQGGNGDASFAKKPEVDLEAYYISRAFEDVVSICRQAVDDASTVAGQVSSASRTANSAVKSAAAELNYPGFPPERLDTPVPRPRAPRPRDLAPAWLDFMFASTPRADPYSLPAGGGHSPFGFPPLPTPGPETSAGSGAAGAATGPGGAASGVAAAAAQML